VFIFPLAFLSEFLDQVKRFGINMEKQVVGKNIMHPLVSDGKR